jgi:hypothetical protein
LASNHLFELPRESELLRSAANRGQREPHDQKKPFHQLHSTTIEAKVAVATVLRLMATISLADTDVVQPVSVVL